MKIILLFFVSVFLSSPGQAHEYFFGFADLSYNAEEMVFEGTISLSTHDFEELLEYKDLSFGPLSSQESTDEALKFIGSELFNGFKLMNEGQIISLILVGFEVDNNGLTSFYFESKKIEKPDTLNIQFDLLMEIYPKQQNKINYQDGFTSQSAVFLNNSTTASLKL